MLCGSPLGALLHGSQVSILPVETSRRCTPAKPLFCVHTFPSTCEYCGLTMLTCAASMFCSEGSFQVVNFVVLGSNLRIVAWYMLPSHRLPSLSLRSPSSPVGNPGLCTSMGNSLTSPVFGSSRPRFCSPKLEYQAMPCLSTITSCGEIVSRGRSYSV